ncbi:MAG: TonB-dependent receptor plug domain-containing protein [Saprospiraceae bacterium]
MNRYLLISLLWLMAQVNAGAQAATKDTLQEIELSEVVVSASRVSESLMRSPVSIEQLKTKAAQLLGTPDFFDALQYTKGVQVLAPSLGFKVLNTRGFANTTNVRFAQLVDGMDNQAPHIGAPIANAMGVTDLDIEKVEIIPGTASALYGMNAINGLANFITKNPFTSTGIAFRQTVGLNHLSDPGGEQPHVFSESQFRIAHAFSPKWAFKVNAAWVKGYDWVADNQTDLAATLNAVSELTGQDNPSFIRPTTPCIGALLIKADTVFRAYLKDFPTSTAGV